MSGDAVGTVLTIDGTTYTYAQLPQSFTWAAGANHSISATTPASGGSGKQYVWQSWTNGNGLATASGTFTVPASTTTVTANYQAQYQISFAANPPAGGTTSPSGTNVWENAGSLPIQASLNSGYGFIGWNSTGSITFGNSSALSTIANINSACTITANFGILENITFAAPNGMINDAVGTVLTIDGTTYTYNQLPQTFSWASGSVHSVSATTPTPAGSGKQYAWQSWTNGNGLATASGTITVPTSNTVITANYKTQYQVTFAVSPSGSGTTSPSAATWYDAGVMGQGPITAAKNNGYTFSSWSASPPGSVNFASAGSSSTTITVNSASTVTATFTQNAPQTIFADDFSTGINAGRWPTQTNVVASSFSPHSGGGQYASFNNNGVLASQSIAATNYNSITLSYWRNTDAGVTLTIQWRIGAGSWTTVETVSGGTGWAPVSFNLGSSADGQTIQIRFTTNNALRARVDDVVVSGIPN
jgi:hypothetical protein